MFAIEAQLDTIDRNYERGAITEKERDEAIDAVLAQQDNG
jgi:hypothetical protein